MVLGTRSFLNKEHSALASSLNKLFVLAQGRVQYTKSSVHRWHSTVVCSQDRRKTSANFQATMLDEKLVE